MNEEQPILFVHQRLTAEAVEAAQLREKLIAYLRQMGFSISETSVAVDHFYQQVTMSTHSAADLMPVYLEKMKEIADARREARRQAEREEERKEEYRIAKKKEKRASTLEDIAVFVPTGPPVQGIAGEMQRGMRLTRQNRKQVLNWKLQEKERQKQQARQAKRKGKP